MAGNYPDVPAPRMAYDMDGSTMFMLNPNTNALTLLSGGGLASLNSETGTAAVFGYGSGGYYRGIIFPQLRDVSAYFINNNGNTYQWSYGATQVSTNTTNGIDGTWTTIESNFSFSTIANYRSAIKTVTGATGIIAIRFYAGAGPGSITNNWGAFHLYGQYSAAGDRLLMWDPALDQALGGAALDFGDVQQGNIQTKTFRIKNQSATLTANSITIDDQALTDFTPSIPPQYDYSLDGGATYTQTLSIGNLGPGAISSVITVRKSTPNNAALSLHTLRITATASSWS